MKQQLNLFPDQQPAYKEGDVVNGKRVVRTKHGDLQLVPITGKTKEQYIEQARQLWGDKYDYTDSVYVENKKPIIIYCPKHDYHFRVAMAQNHILKPNGTFRPTGCPICEYERKYGGDFGPEWRDTLKLSANSNRAGLIDNVGRQKLTEKEKARRKAERDAVTAERQRIRKEERRKAFEEKLAAQKAETQRRQEERKAERKRQAEEKEQQRIKELQEMFLREAPKAQGEGYQYRGVENITSKSSRVMVHCPNPDHQWHPMRVDLILQGCKCRECAGRHVPREKRAADFLKRAYKKYGHDMFDLSRVPDQYDNNDTYVELKCLKHNFWYLVTPDTFIRCAGGCPICNTSKGEMEIILWLRDHNVRFEKEPIWYHNNLYCKRSYLKPDFWLPDHNLIIEYNGEQHYEQVIHFSKEKDWTLEDQQERDMTLRDLCRQKNIRLLEIPYTEFDNIKEILTQNIKIGKKVH